MRVTQVVTYPVKSLGGVPSQRATVTGQGLAGDRRWALLDGDGHRVSARECHAMLSITAHPVPGGLRLVCGGDAVDVGTPGAGAPRVPSRISRIDELTLADEEASRWLSERLGRDLRLVHQADGQHRAVGRSHGGRPGDTMALADTCPILLVTEASLDRLREWVAQELGSEWLSRADAARRFRPNLVVDGGEPFEEDRWERVRIGEVTYRLGELCDRCVMTTVDLTTYRTTKEPIRTLARHRKWEGRTWFGVRLIPEAEGTVAEGDAVSVLASAGV